MNLPIKYLVSILFIIEMILSSIVYLSNIDHKLFFLKSYHDLAISALPFNIVLLMVIYIISFGYLDKIKNKYYMAISLIAALVTQLLSMFTHGFVYIAEVYAIIHIYILVGIFTFGIYVYFIHKSKTNNNRN